jgi:hypothetical protein
MLISEGGGNPFTNLRLSVGFNPSIINPLFGRGRNELTNIVIVRLGRTQELERMV